MSSKNALEFINSIASFLKEHSIPDAEREAALLFTFATGIDRVSLYRDNPAVTEGAQKRLTEMITRRARREPIQYIIGHVEFFGLRIHVGPGVLIPRPETELLVEESLRQISVKKSGEKTLCVLDLCTGSGCIALAMAKKLPSARVVGVDSSPDALNYARENALKNGIGNITFLEGPLFEPVKGMTFDAILSNPPYIKGADMEALAPEIRDWEPGGALDGGTDGLHFYRLILKDAGSYLKPGGFIALETGAGQSESVALIARENELSPIKTIKDYAGIERVIVFERAAL